MFNLKGKGNPLWRVAKNKNKQELQDMHELKMSDEWNPKFHLSSYSGLLNDPVGLTKFKDDYHIFYQWSPFSAEHGLKHWGHFATKDFVKFNHTGIAIAPELETEIDGVYSGGAYSDDKNMQLFWTGNVKYSLDVPDNEKETERTSFTHTGEWDPVSNKLLNREVLFEVDKNVHTGHFRDPLPVKYADKYYLLHAAQKTNSEPVLTLYRSDNLKNNYKFFKDIQFSTPLPKNIRMFECPGYFKVKDKDAFIFTIQRDDNFDNFEEENRDLSIVIVGKMDWENGIFKNETIQKIDHGFSFYAQQTFQNTDPLIMGWLVNQGFEELQTRDNKWAHALSWPRVIKFEKNKLKFYPHEAYKKLRENTVDFNLVEKKLIPSEINVYGDFKIKVFNESGKLIITKKDGNLTVDRRNESSDVIKENSHRTVEFGNNETKILFDTSIVEIFSNGEVFTFKYFLNDPKISFDGDLKESYQLKKLEINWNV